MGFDFKLPVVSNFSKKVSFHFQMDLRLCFIIPSYFRQYLHNQFFTYQSLVIMDDMDNLGLGILRRNHCYPRCRPSHQYGQYTLAIS